MKAVRIGNDVRNILIPVTRFAEPFVDWDSLVDLKVHAVERNRRKYFVTPTTIYKEEGQLRVYFSAEDLQLGIYDILITFSIADPINQDGQQPKIIDIQKAFSVVEHTSQEIDSQDDFTVSLDFAKDGLSYYQIWLQYFEGSQEDMIAWHRQPSVDAAALANEKANLADGKATLANDAATLANEKANLADGKATLANDAATLANEKATLADGKATLANDAATLANEKANLADGKATLANDAATLANEKANLADGKATLANDAATLANEKATLADGKATLANDAATLANEKANLADSKATLANDAATLANEKANLADGKATLANDAATLANEKANLADVKAALANDAAALANEKAGDAQSTIDRLDELEISLVAAAKLMPTLLEVDYPQIITSGNNFPKKITAKLYPGGYTRNILYLGDNKAVSVQPDGLVIPNEIGISLVHVVPTENTTLYQTLSIQVVPPNLRMAGDDSIRLSDNNIRLT